MLTYIIRIIASQKLKHIMPKKYILITALCTVTTTVFASKPVDSIGVENNNGKKLIVHKVDPKESYYSIARKYNANVKDLQTFNNNVSLQIGTVIKVPTEIPFGEKVIINSNAPVLDLSSFNYVVAQKDNLNLIAEKFATSVAEIKKLNNLTSNDLKVGQSLKIPFIKSGTTAVTEKAIVTPKVNSNTEVATTPQQVKPTATTHKVQPREYLGVIARQYGVSIEDLKAANNLQGNNLSIGQVLTIPSGATNTTPSQKELPLTPEINAVTPIVNGKTIEYKPANETATNTSTFEHIVASGETIYGIAQKYQLTTYQLKNLNNLTSNTVNVGQKLIIKGTKPAETTVAANNTATATEPNDDIETLKTPTLRRGAAAYGLNRVEEKGTATWISDPDLDANKMLILHRTASVGTVIQITNPMTNRSTFAKVVGKFTENESTKDVIVVMTKAVADAVGALDKRFFCTLSYGSKENEK